MRFGLKAHHTDLDDMLALGPEAIEFVLFEEDVFDIRWTDWVRVPLGLRLSVHAPEHIGGQIADLSSPDDDYWRYCIEVIQSTIEVARLLAPRFEGSPIVVVHPGGIRQEEEETPPDRLLRAIWSLDMQGVEVCLENMPEHYWVGDETWRGTLFKDPDQIERLLWEIGVDLCLDVSHAAMWCNHHGQPHQDFITSLRGKVRHVHLADTKGATGEGLQIGEGDIDYNHLSRILGPLDVVGVPEIKGGHLNGGAGFAEARDRLRLLGFF